VGIILTTLGLLPLAWALPALGTNAAECSPLELIIARGTTEPTLPDYGIVVGDPMYEAVKGLFPEVTGYAVDYPASFATNSKVLGSADVVKHLTEQTKKCPKQKFSLIGYSQGGDVMHGAAVQLPASIFPSIVALVLFGDPGNRGANVRSPLGGMVPAFPAELEKKVKQNCEKGDPVCTNSGMQVGNHLVYSDPTKGYIKASAEYILEQFKTDGKAGPRPSPNGGEKDKGNNTAALLQLGEILGGKKGELAALAGVDPKSNLASLI